LLKENGEFQDQLDRIFKEDKKRSYQASQQKQPQSAVRRRIIEVESSLQLCNALLSSIDPNTRNFAFTFRTYWQNEQLKLAPYMAEELTKILEELPKKLAKLLEKEFKLR
jgi:hypothetical protein